MSQNHNSTNASRLGTLEFHPLTPERWSDLELLFGSRGACGGCWCMWWRLKRSEFEKQKGDGNRAALKKIVESGTEPGIIAYSDKQAIGWCSTGPRESFSALERSRILRPIDQEKVWSIVCLFVAKAFRNQGISVNLLSAAVEFAKSRGGRIVEGYPVEPKKGKTPDVFAFTGLASAFRQAGFQEVLRRSDTRPIMRLMRS